MNISTLRRTVVRPKNPLLIALLLLVFLVLPFTALLLQADTSVEKAPDGSEAAAWRQVREGVAGYTAVKGRETGVLIQGSGQNWRQLRNGAIAAAGAWTLGATFLSLGGFFLVRGKVRLAKPRSGRKLLRWSGYERLLHWYTAILFLLLAVTGLSLLYGRAAVIPLIGHEAFAAYATWAKLLHNYLGPFFIAGLLLMGIAWARDNLPNRLDIEWLKAFGGMIGKRHPSAGRMNAGEKAWFWLLMFAGLAVSVSGLLLDFPNFGQVRSIQQLAHLSHVVPALILIAGAFGHIYIGTVGTEGAFTGMITGYVDETWAEQHHDHWLKEINQTGDETAAKVDEEETKLADA